MIIYRFEREGLGPWGIYNRLSSNEGWVYSRLKKSFWESRERHPAPYPDGEDYDKVDEWAKGLKSNASSLFFGCSSLKQLNVWFNREERFFLKLLNFDLCVYKCPKKIVWNFGNQVAFIKNHPSTELVKTRPF